MPYVLRPAANRLNTRKGDLIELPPADAGAVDAKRRIWPERAQFLRVLLDQFLLMRQHQNARLWPFLERIAAEFGNDDAFA